MVFGVMVDKVDRSRVFGEHTDAVERIAPGYFEHHFVAEHVARYKWAARWVNARRVLDVACGTGYGAALLRAAGACSVLSFDLSTDALRFGSNAYGITGVCTDALNLPLANASCPVAVSLETIEHLGNPAGFLQEIRRVLIPGGDLLLSTPNSARSTGHNPYHLSEMTLAELRAELAVAGFDVKGIWGQRWGLPGQTWNRVVGIRRLLHEIERIPSVVPLVSIGLKPIYFCLRAVAA